LLTKPFINSISAFDATAGSGTNIALSILDSDVITSFTYTVYDNQTGIAVTGLENVLVLTPSDVDIEDIRTYTISIGADILENNTTYAISAITTDGTFFSPRSQQTIFECYVQPSFTIQYLSGSSYVDLTTGTTINSSNIDIQLVFNTNDNNSNAVLNNAQITLYGINNSTQTILFTGNNLYNSPLQENVTGFTPTVDSGGVALPSRLYESYTISVSGTTIDNFYFTNTIDGLKCAYDVLINSPYLQLTNLADRGIIEIITSLTDYQGVLNPTPTNWNSTTTYNVGDVVINDSIYYICTATNTNQEPPNATYWNLLYIDGKEIDLSSDDRYVEWKDYFISQEPYTFRIWGRNFNNGEIISKILCTEIGQYINLTYNNDGTNTYISLECGQNDYLGNPMFPYYIESNKILTSSITSTTLLFIGVQQDDSIFNLDLELIYNVTFEENGGIEINDIISNNLIELPIPLRDGYIFDGWYLESDFSGTRIDTNLPLIVNEDIILYAKWI